MQFIKGFVDLDNEVNKTKLSVLSGEVPRWLTGALLRNGPGRFQIGEEKYLHWFDGLAMLHGFYFREGSVHYGNSYIKTRAYTKGMASNKILYPSFATSPTYNWLQSLIMWFKQPESGHNTGVSVARLGGEYLALTESTEIVSFDDETLETKEVIEFEDDVSGEMTSAHPHYDFNNKQLLNFSVKLGRKSEYLYYRCQNNIRQRQLVGRIPVDLPSYTHSFAMTNRYIVHVDFPLVVHPLRLRFGNIPYINCYKWKPERGTRFTVLDKASGDIVKQYHVEACFAFHHVNAFEQGNDVIVDLANKPDASVINDLFLQHLRSCEGRPVQQPSQLQRYILPLQNSEIRRETVCEEYIEMPTINYRCHNAQEYRYTYGISSHQDHHEDFENQLIKINTRNGSHIIWYEADCYPWEPVFVQDPKDDSEDGGVLLSVVLDTGQDRCFLLILNAKNFQELARVALPHIIPLGFHAQFFRTP